MKLYLNRAAWTAAALFCLGTATYLTWNRAPQATDPAASDPKAVGEQTSALEEAALDLARRVAARQAVVRAVIEGRLSLTEAADEFQELDLRSKTFHWDVFRQQMPGATDQERQCRAVLTHVRLQLAHDPDAAQALCQRLETELQTYLDRQAGGAP